MLGCLVEKQHTTPDAYPLSLNALRLACNQSTNRDFADLAAVQATLEQLVGRGQVARHERQPGQKEDRYEQLLGGAAPSAPPAAADSPPASGPDEAPPAELKPAEDRLTRLERELAELRAELAALRAELGD